MKPKTLAQLKQRLETYGDWHGGEVMFIKYQQDYIAALEARLQALEPITPPAPDVSAPTVWPDAPRICECGENKDNDLVCPNCGGYLF